MYESVRAYFECVIVTLPEGLLIAINVGLIQNYKNSVLELIDFLVEDVKDREVLKLLVDLVDVDRLIIHGTAKVRDFIRFAFGGRIVLTFIFWPSWLSGFIYVALFVWQKFAAVFYFLQLLRCLVDSKDFHFDEVIKHLVKLVKIAWPILKPNTHQLDLYFVWHSIFEQADKVVVYKLHSTVLELYHRSFNGVEGQFDFIVEVMGFR